MVASDLAEAHDNEKGNHIPRMQRYVKILATQLRAHPRFSATLSSDAIAMMARSAPLHDIGKMGIPESILYKAGQLSPEEFEIMQTHTMLGFEVLEKVEATLGTAVDFLRTAKEMALHHHERWDGTGYPQGLSGEAIPLSARIMAVADAYDALTSHKTHTSSVPHAEAALRIAQDRGTHFDPDVTDAFLERQADFQSIAQRLADTDHGASTSAQASI